jgi:hypothetical protein
VIYLVIACFTKKCQCADNCHTKHHKALFWGTLIRLMLEGYLELSLSVFVSLKNMSWEYEGYSVLYNNVFSIIVTVMLVSMPMMIYGFYMCNVDEMEEEEFKVRYGNIYDGLVLDKNPFKRRRALFYPFWFVTRRLIMALMVIFLEKYFWYQIFVAMLCGLINICYLCKYKPFVDPKI